MLRALWTQRSVTVDGRFHHIRAAGLAPLPVQRPIPIWIGAYRPGRLAPGRAGRRRLVPPGPPGRRPRAGARDHPRGGGRGRARPVDLRVRGEGRVRHPRPRQDGRARPPLARGRREPSVGQHHACGSAERRCAHRSTGGDGCRSCCSAGLAAHEACQHEDMPDEPTPDARPDVALATIAKEWGRIGCTGFGGPPTHIAMLRRLAVEREGWLGGDRVRGRHRGDEPAPGAGVDAAGHLLRLAAARPAGRAGRRRVLHLPRAGGHHRAGRASSWPPTRPPGSRAPRSGPAPRWLRSRSTPRSA